MGLDRFGRNTTLTAYQFFRWGWGYDEKIIVARIMGIKESTAVEISNDLSFFYLEPIMYEQMKGGDFDE